MKVPFKRAQSGKQNVSRPAQPGGGLQYAMGMKQPASSQRAGVQSPQQKIQTGGEDTLTSKIIDTIVRVSIYITVFLLPLFFLTNVPSVLELNKQVLLVVVTGFGFLAWVGKMAWKNEIRFKKNFILVPIVTFVAIMGLSTVFSTYFEQSMWGFFGGEGRSFITLLFMVALFLLIFNTVKNRGEAVKMVLVFLIGGFLLGLYGLLQIWEVYLLPSEVAENPFFNTIGSVYIFNAYVAALFLLTLALFLSDVSKVLKIVLIALSFFFFFIMMVINFKIVWIATIICIALLFGVTIMKGGTTGSQSRVLPMIFLVLALLMILRKQPIIQKDLPVEVLLNYRSSTKIALDSFKKHPLLGSGPTTYSTVYQQARPENLGDFWAVNFNNGTSYFLTLTSTVGLLGALSFLFLVGTGLVYLFKTMVKAVSTEVKGDKNYIAIGIGTVWLFTTIILFGYLANISLLLLWWFSFALFLSFTLLDPTVKTKEFVTTSATPRSSLVFSFVFVLVIIGFVAAIYMQSQKYIAATHFNKALVADSQGAEVEDVAERIQKAIQFDPNRDIYYRNLSIAMFALANERIAEKTQDDLTPEDSNYISGMIRGALGAADQARTLDPNNPENHLSVARIYEGMLATMEGAEERVIESYDEAIELDSTNPALYHRLASVYVALSDLEVSKVRAQNPAGTSEELPEESLKYLAMAKDNLEKSLEIKPDFAAANLLLAGVYEREGNMEMAIKKEKNNKTVFPAAPGIAFRLGLLYYKDEQFDNAKQEFEAAVSLDKDYANALYFLGLVLDKQGDKTGALKSFERVSELNPTNDDVKEIVQNLRNGQDALAGIEQVRPTASPVPEQSPTQPAEQQTSIDPGVENQEIPEEATPSIEEIDGELPPEEEAPPGEGPTP
ncbi:MAG: tetratricopeptide repeat protein [Patescibacteria group bacterium]|nr:tetratricopeptide repeat protein [Patescibacteria group bacterium]